MLGVDYGRKKIGLALAEGSLAEPMGVVRVGSANEAVRKVKQVIEEENIERLVLGLSEGEMAEETEEFGRKLEKELEIPVAFQDETLSTKMAQDLSIKAGIRRKKRRFLEDAYSAAIILQAYLDTKEQRRTLSIVRGN